MPRLLPVRRPHERVKLSVGNQSSRNGARPRLIVLHDTESVNIPHSDQDLRNIGAWFNNPAAQASSHVCVDAEGRSAQYVPDDCKAWHVAYYNSPSLGIEQIAKATQTFWPDAQLKKTAKYIAYWSKKYGIPITHTSADGHGVVLHSDLGTLGGGHHDPGPNFPMGVTLRHASYYSRNGWI